MFVPFVSPRKLFRRKGGGGVGRGSSSTSSSVKSSAGSSSSSGSSGKTKSSSSSWWSSSNSNTKTKSSTKSSIWKSSSSNTPQWNKVVGVAAAIPAGFPFAGRVAGGGTRDSIMGTRTYGSGYPGVVGRGTSGRGFPFFFWPLTWPLAVGAGTGLYLHSNYEYGAPNNSTRPGGSMAYAIFPSPSDSTNPSTFRFLSDNATVALMIFDVGIECEGLFDLSTFSSTPIAFTDSTGVGGTAGPGPEQAIQYYRASSAALTLDGYNNTATYGLEGSADSPLPASLDSELLTCLNTTIGVNLPLIDGATGLHAPIALHLVGSLGVILCLLQSWL
ncbi:hypothetical protein FA15DRAFT_645745 [Coprinopsis marcescibilis]|uniref:Uncharacterized protein n=1 Tax=Coprinopsis marcescibilis TaxID=230819 RepID=A0A5C3KLU7_COPMA|nr:hypothetical protein FA15DRAFT_645745 [Coprinopsis marcescibilis]